MRWPEFNFHLLVVLVSILTLGGADALAQQQRLRPNSEIVFGEVGPDTWGGILAAPAMAWCQEGVAKVELRSFDPARTSKAQEAKRAELIRQGLNGQALERASDRRFDEDKQRLEREVVAQLEQSCPGLKAIQLAHVWGPGLLPMRFCMRRGNDWTEVIGGCDAIAEEARNNLGKFSLNLAVKDEAEIRGWSETYATSFSTAMTAFAAADLLAAMDGPDAAARLGMRSPPGKPFLNQFQPEQLLAEHRYDDVVRLIRPALAGTGERALPSPERARRLNLLAAAFEGLGRPADAVNALEEAASLENVDLSSGYSLPSLMRLGMLYERGGRFEDAALVYDRGIALAQAAERRPDSPPATILLDRAFLMKSAFLLHKRARADISQRARLLTLSELRFQGAMNASLKYEHTVVRGDSVPIDILAAYDRDASLDWWIPLTGAAWAQLAFEMGDPDHLALARRLAVPAREVLTHLQFETPFLAEVKTLMAALDRNSTAFRDALASVRATFGPDDPVLAYALTEQARTLLDAGDTVPALDAAREATNILIRRADRISGDQGLDAQAELADARRAFDAHLEAAWQRAQEDPASADVLAREGFVLSQRLQQTAAGQAMARSLVRLASGGTAAKLLRERRDLAERWAALDREALVETLQPPDQRHKAEGLRQQIQQISARRTELDELLQTLAPGLAELARPRVMDIDQTQAALRPDEAALLFHIGEKGSFIWVVTADAAHWHRIPLGAEAVEHGVVNLRGGLDHEGKRPGTFSTNEAFRFYHDLLGEVAPELQRRPQLLVVPDGALQSLPFYVLVTEPPPPELPNPYQHVAWLIRTHSVQTLPSLGSLSVRSIRTEVADQAFIGFGDPLLDDTGPSTRGGAYPATDLRGVADPAQVRRMGRLPDTADEIRQLATAMGADATSVLLGPDATEAKLLALDRDGVLARRRIIAFATHALVASKITGIAEPALVLTPPVVASAEDDGLLTASEIAGLRLNADWVILSACNTAANDRPGAESLSGLARAFFQAGARSLLVSHWPVASDAAVRLTTSTLNAMRRDTTLTRAEALRRAMLAFIDSTPTDADPWRWAPFVVVGGEN